MRASISPRFAPSSRGSGSWFPSKSLVGDLGADVQWDSSAQALTVEGRPAFGATLVDGRAYIPHDRAESMLGVRIQWSPGMRLAEVRSPKVRIPGNEGEEEAFWRDGQVFVPLRFVATYLGYTLGWNQSNRTAYVGGNPVQGVVRGGRVYASLSSLRSVVSDLDYAWDEDTYSLELRFGEGPPGGAEAS